MSVVSISYDSLKSSAYETGKVSKKMDEYISSLKSSVYDKLTQYSGENTENIKEATQAVQKKISELEEDMKEFGLYGVNLLGLCDQCEKTDDSVAKKVASLTGDFRKNYNIPDGGKIDAIRNFLTVELNKTALGRWIGGKLSDLSAWGKGLKDRIKEWYHFKGGKELINKLPLLGVKIAVAVAAIAVAVTSGAAIGFVIAGVIAGVIALVNAMVDGYNEVKAHNMQRQGDAAVARRRRNLNSFQEVWRSSFVYGERGEDYKSGKGWKMAANLLDVTEIACSLALLWKSGGEFAKNVYKWGTQSGTSLSSISFKEVFKIDTLKAVVGRGKEGLQNTTRVFKKPNYKIWDFGKKIPDELKKKLASEYFDFSSKKAGAESVKNFLEAIKSLMEAKNEKEFLKEGVKKIVFPSVTMFEVVEDGKQKTIRLNAVTSLWDDTKSIGEKFSISKESSWQRTIRRYISKEVVRTRNGEELNYIPVGAN